VTSELTWLVLAGIVAVSAGQSLARAASLPREIVWFVLGLGIALLAGATRPDAPLEWREAIAMSMADTVLPLLVFAGAWSLDRRALGSHFAPSAVLAAVALSTGVWLTATVLTDMPSASTPWIGAVILGATLATTDPHPATRQLARRAPRGIATLLNGESVFTAAGAGCLVSMALHGLPPEGTEPTWLDLGRDVLRAFAGGAVIGAALAAAAIAVTRRCASAVLPHWAALFIVIGTCQFADAFESSRVAGALIAGLVLARAPSMTVAAPFWLSLGRGTRALAFLAGGVILPHVGDAATLRGNWPIALGAILLMALARFTAVYTVTTATHRLSKMGITPREQFLITAFGIHGATVLALALSLPKAFAFTAVIQWILLTVVAFDLLVTTPATPWLARRFANSAPLSTPIPRKIALRH